MGRFVTGADRSQMTLLPESLDDWVGEDNPVHVIETSRRGWLETQMQGQDIAIGQERLLARSNTEAVAPCPVQCRQP